MDLRIMAFDSPLFSVLQHLHDAGDDSDKSVSCPSRTYARDAKAMAATAADVKVQVEDDNVVVISGERKREEEKEGAKYVRMERRVGKFMRKFALLENANTDKILAVCQDGVLTVTVEKLPPKPLRSRSLDHSL